MSAGGGGRALSICVFCGSAESPPEVFVDPARQLGEEIGRRGHRLIYGGTPIGLMGVVARAVRANGGPVVGVVPRGLFDDLTIDGSAGELVVAQTLAERTAEMVARADAFVVLPGGYGTLEELVEVLTLRQLGRHTRPVVLVNVDDFWQSFLQHTQHMAILGFAQAGEGVLFHVVELARRGIDLVETAVTGEPARPVADGTVKRDELMSSGPGADQERRVRSYFRKPESRILYRLFLRGTKHFGYYPPGSRRLSMASAMRMMEDKLGTTLKLPPGSRVLDAGCGEGDVAIRMATAFGLHVEGVDLLEFSLDKAHKKARKLGLEDLLRFHRMDYANLRFPDQTFDGAYTMETLVHAFDHERALQELLRVLKPGGKLVLFEYSIAPRHHLSAAQEASFDFSVAGGAMPSLPSFIHGAFPAILERAGFVAVSVQDITERMIPMLKRFAQIGYVPCQLGKLLRLQGELVNCTSAVQVYRHRSVWRYNIVTADRPR